jgi:hypothetical protein
VCAAMQTTPHATTHGVAARLVALVVASCRGPSWPRRRVSKPHHAGCAHRKQASEPRWSAGQAMAGPGGVRGGPHRTEARAGLRARRTRATNKEEGGEGKGEGEGSPRRLRMQTAKRWGSRCSTARMRA